MALTGQDHVTVPVQAHLHRPPGLARPDRRHSRPGVCLSLLAPEPTAHPDALHHHLVERQPKGVRDNRLRLRWMLRRTVDHHPAVLISQGDRDVGLQREVVLRTHPELTAHDGVTGLSCPRQLRIHIPTTDPLWIGMDTVQPDRIGRIKDGVEFLVGHHHPACALSSRINRRA